jgi:hypothetical protein
MARSEARTSFISYCPFFLPAHVGMVADAESYEKGIAAILILGFIPEYETGT